MTGAYRQALRVYEKQGEDYTCPTYLCDEVQKVSHRRYSTGFFFGRPEQGQYYEDGGYVRGWDVVATIDTWHDGLLYCTQRGKFSVGDDVEICSPDEIGIGLKIEAIYDESGSPITATPHAMMKFSIPFPHPIKEYSLIRKEKTE